MPYSHKFVNASQQRNSNPAFTQANYNYIRIDNFNDCIISVVLFSER